MPDLDIIVVSHNTKEDLDRCLDSLHNPVPQVPHQIVVIDNASQDGSIGMVRTRWPDVRVIALDRNIGFGAANNVGFRATTSELVLLLNSDTIVPARAVDRLVRALKDRPDVSIAGPKLVDREGRAELSFGRMISPIAELRQKALLWLRRPIERLTSRPQEVDWVSAACLLVKRRAAEAAGLFDERYFMYCEDVDFCAAVRANGGRIYFTPEVEVVHIRGRSRLANQRATAEAYRRSQLAFYRKHHPAWAPLLRLYLALKGKLPVETADKTGY